MLQKIYKASKVIFINYSTCIYYPGCSEYFIMALKKYGIKGILKGILRILRCNPFSKGGVDFP